MATIPIPPKGVSVADKSVRNYLEGNRTELVTARSDLDTLTADVNTKIGDVGTTTNDDREIIVFDSENNKFINSNNVSADGHLTIKGTSSLGGELRFEGFTDSGGKYIAFQAPDFIVDSVTYTLPLIDGDSSSVLRTDGAGLLSWNTLGLDDLNDVVLTAPATGEVIRYNGSSWIDDRVALDDLSDVVITAAASGEVIRYNGTNWVDSTVSLNDLSDVTITAGSSGEVLRHNGSAWVDTTLGFSDLTEVSLGTPALGDVLGYSGSAWVEVPGITLTHFSNFTGASQVDFTGLSANFFAYMIVFQNIVPATDNVWLGMRTSTNNGSSFNNTLYTNCGHSVDTGGGSGVTTNASTSELFLTGAGHEHMGNDTSTSCDGVVYLISPLSTVYTPVVVNMNYRGATNIGVSYFGVGKRAVNEAVNAFTIFASTGNISGNIRVYGIGL